MDKHYIVQSCRPPNLKDFIHLMQDVLDNLYLLAKNVKFGDVSSSKPFYFMWSLFRSSYLSACFPMIKDLCQRNEIETTEMLFSYQSCPAPMLHLLLNFISKCLIYNDQHPETQMNDKRMYEGCRKLLWENELDREILHEIIRNGLCISLASHLEISRSACHILRCILFTVNSFNLNLNFIYNL